MRLGLGIRFLAAATLLTPLVSPADELTLKDGTKIAGTIVGFEENSFKVRTSYGFAVVQKDQVASISMAEQPQTLPDKKPDSAAGSENPQPPKTTKIETATTPAASLAAPSAAAKPAAATPEAGKKPERLPAEAPARAIAKTSDSRAAAATAQTSAPAAAASGKPAPTAPNSGATPRALAPAPSPQSAVPEPIREQVSGNTYTNETFGFQMYKPPTWNVIAGLPSILPGAIAAMGTNDQTTYLLIGQESVTKSVAAARNATEHRLRDILDNFRSLGETTITVSGTPATGIRFRGGADEHDWSGIAVFVPHGPRLFTIFGMTLADSDLVQIQENVIARAISSLQFTKQ